MNDSWSSEERFPVADEAPSGEAARGGASSGDLAQAPAPRRADRHRDPEPGLMPRERYPWVGLAFLLSGIAVGGIGLSLIALELDRPGLPEVAPERWWVVVGGGLVVAWSAPWFLRPRGRRRMAIVVGIGTAIVGAVAAIALAGLQT